MQKQKEWKQMMSVGELTDHVYWHYWIWWDWSGSCTLGQSFSNEGIRYEKNASINSDNLDRLFQAQ